VLKVKDRSWAFCEEGEVGGRRKKRLEWGGPRCVLGDVYAIGRKDGDVRPSFLIRAIHGRRMRLTRSRSSSIRLSVSEWEKVSK
jgi:hypothetical protein